MKATGHEILEAARTYIGGSFRDHFDPENICASGTITTTGCMERGLGQNDAFDCSGLVIASICKAMGKNVHEWPEEYRHARQLLPLAERTRSAVGDIAVFQRSPVIHLGILAAEMVVIHSSELSGQVEEGAVMGRFNVSIIPFGKLIDLTET